MKQKIDFREALEILEKCNIDVTNKERVFLQDSFNRILADDIYAKEDMPPIPLSNMDGYAISSKFVDQYSFCVSSSNRAGNESIPTLDISKPYAIKTFTGAAMPIGADMLIPVERVECIGDSINVLEHSSVGEFIRQPGANYKKGEKLLSKGTVINSNHIGLLAGLNCVFVDVYERPKVGILVSGDEILELGESSQYINNIYNTNGHMLYAKIKECGAIPKLYKILRDNKEDIEQTLNDALMSCDLVISTGGASVGDYDFISKIAKEREDEVVFKGVNIKPGQHVLYARFFGKHFFGLPGFPNSTLVTFELFVKKILHRMCGGYKRGLKFKVPLGIDIVKRDKRVEFRVCNVIEKDGEISINFDNKKDFLSAILNNFCPLDDSMVGIVVLDREFIGSRDMVEVILL